MPPHPEWLEITTDLIHNSRYTIKALSGDNVSKVLISTTIKFCAQDAIP